MAIIGPVWTLNRAASTAMLVQIQINATTKHGPTPIAECHED